MGKVLIIADHKGRGVATPRGLQLAAKLGHDADVVAFAYEALDKFHVPRDEHAAVKARLLSDREQQVQERIARFAQPEQKVSLKVVWEKDVLRWVNKRCASGTYQAVIKTGSHTESLVHSSTDWQLLRECPAPVLIVAEKRWHRTKPVLVALDVGSSVKSKRSLNHKVIAAGKALAEALGVDLEIITAVEIPAFLKDLDLIDPASYTAEAREEMAPHLRELAEAHDIPEARFLCKRGPVEKVITSRAAKVRAQIVVMGTVGRTGVKARLLGNTAEKVIRHMKTDVLAIKP
jgi:universal stress protein E